jgi:DNA invertase Pin-like site-specific DNA recombinase
MLVTDCIIQHEIRVSHASHAEQKMLEAVIYDVRMLHAIFGSYEKVSRQLGVSRDTVRRWYQGSHIPLNLKFWIKIKEVLAREMLSARNDVSPLSSEPVSGSA